LAGGGDEDAETPGEERIESFNDMPPYLQAAILGVKDPDLRGRLMDDQDLAETYYQYGQATRRLREIDPDNPLLDTIHAADWMPTEEDVSELREARDALKETVPTSKPVEPGILIPPDPLIDTNQRFETTAPVEVSGRRAIDASRTYEEGVRDLYGKIGPRNFLINIDGREVTGIADSVTLTEGGETAVEAKYVEDWSQSIRNPASPIGREPWATQEQRSMIEQARRYSENFSGGVIYHTNSIELAEYYTNAFKSDGVQNFRFIITPTKMKEIDMRSDLEKAIGSRIYQERKVPGTFHIEGNEYIYFSDNGKEEFGKQFYALAGKIKPPYQKRGGAISQACRIRLPDGSLFHGMSYRGDIEGWRRQIQEGAKELGVLLATIQDQRLVVSDGRSAALADCLIEMD